MKIITSSLLCLFTAWVHAGSLPDIFVTEAPTGGGGIYTVTIFQPPSPPNPIWSVSAWGIVNSDAAVTDTMRTGWTSGVFDVATWDSGIGFETGTPGDPIHLFTSGVSGITDFESLFGPGFPQAAVYWNDSYIGSPLVTVDSNFTWSEGTHRQSRLSGTTTAFAFISSSVGDNLICLIGVENSLPLSCTPITEADTDGDQVPDSTDNCTLAANPGQEDTDFDGFGNACDPDLNNDGVVNFLDLSLFAAVFMTSDPDADFTSDGFVNFLDLFVLSELIFQPPGPSAGF